MISDIDLRHCTLCPRECGADRVRGAGYCGGGEQMRIARIALHAYEEPPISGTRGSGAVFFCGCALRCGYCQNYDISQGGAAGKAYTPAALAEKMRDLVRQGAHNINLVTAAHYLPQVVETLRLCKRDLGVPVVYNSSGYEKVSALRMLEGLVDVYLPDFKYIDADVAKKYSDAPDYACVAVAAIEEMVRQTGEYTERDGLVQRGTIVRHLVLPGQSHAGVRIMECIAEKFPAARVSVMRQYTPTFNRTGDKALSRTVTSLEYDRVLGAAAELGLQGFSQGAASATAAYTPNFSEE